MAYERFEEYLANSTKANKNLVIIFLLYTTYLLITVLTIRDLQLLFPQLGIKLPMLNVNLSTDAFIIFAPFILLVLYLGVLLHLSKHITLLRQYVFHVASGRSIFRSPVPFFVDFSFIEPNHSLRKLFYFIFFFLILVYPLIVAILFLWRFSAYQNIFFSVFNYLILIILLIAVIAFIKAVLKPDRGLVITIPALIFCVGTLIFSINFAIQGYPYRYENLNKLIKHIAVRFPWFRLSISSSERFPIPNAENYLKYMKAMASNLEKKSIVKSLPRINLSNRSLKFADLTYTFMPYADLSRSRLDGANLKGAILIGTILRNAEFSYSNLSFARLDGADLQGVRLYKAKLKNANLIKTNFAKTTLVNVDFSGSNLRDVNMKGSKLINVKFSKNLVLKRVDFSNATLNKVSLVGVKIKNCNFTKAVFKNSYLCSSLIKNTSLKETIFDKVGLGFVIFQDNNMEMVKFIRSDLRDATFSNDRMLFAEFQDTNLKGSHVEKADLSGAQFIRVDATNSSFSKVDMEKVNLNEVNLSHSNLNRVDMRNGDLSFVDFSFSKLRNVHFDNTILNEVKFCKAKLFNVRLGGLLFFKFYSDKIFPYLNLIIKKPPVILDDSSCDINSSSSLRNFYSPDNCFTLENLKSDLLPTLKQYITSISHSLKIKDRNMGELGEEISFSEKGTSSSWVPIQNVSFCSSKLGNVTITEARISNSTFCATTLEGMRMENVEIMDSKFIDVDLLKGKLIGVNIKNSEFLMSRIEESEVLGVSINKSLLFKTNITGYLGFGIKNSLILNPNHKDFILQAKTLLKILTTKGKCSLNNLKLVLLCVASSANPQIGEYAAEFLIKKCLKEPDLTDKISQLLRNYYLDMDCIVKMLRCDLSDYLNYEDKICQYKTDNKRLLYCMISKLENSAKDKPRILNKIKLLKSKFGLNLEKHNSH